MCVEEKLRLPVSEIAARFILKRSLRPHLKLFSQFLQLDYNKCCFDWFLFCDKGKVLIFALF